MASVVVIAGAAIGIWLLVGRGDSPAEMALKSGRAIGQAAGVRLTGTIVGGNASVTVTRAGTVEGSYTQHGYQISRITIKGVTYLKAPAGFWTYNDVADTPAQQAGGHWALAPEGTVDQSFDLLTPAQLSRALRTVGQHPVVVNTTFGGMKVIKLSSGGARYYITTSSPHRLVHVDGGPGAYSFDVTSLDAATIKPVFTALHDDVQALQGAVDPVALVVAAGTIQFGNCDESSCTVTGKVTLRLPSTQPELLKMTVDFAASRAGAPIVTCTKTVPANADATVSAACRVSGSAWSRWFTSHNGDFAVWAQPRFEATVNSAGDIATLQGELNAEQQGG